MLIKLQVGRYNHFLVSYESLQSFILIAFDWDLVTNRLTLTYDGV